MKKYNAYGLVSGGYIFDCMDRVAQAALEKGNDLCWLTKSASVKFLRQCCKKTTLYISEPIMHFPGNDEATLAIKAMVREDDKDVVVAEGLFVFVSKKNLHCKGAKRECDIRR